MVTERQPPAWQNKRFTGARKLQERPDLHSPDIVHTGDPDDEPKEPYGLTEPPAEDGESKADGAPGSAGPRRR